MAKNNVKGMVMLGLAVAGIVAAELLGPTPVDWTETYERNHTRPYGSRVMYELLPALFPGVEVKAVERPTYLVLQDTVAGPSNYLFITDIFAPDSATTKALLDFVARGNSVFVAAHTFRGVLADTLEVEAPSRGLAALLSAEQQPDTLQLHYVNSSLQRPGGYRFVGHAGRSSFSRVDTARTTVLGTNGAGEVTFVRVDWGEGHVYLSTTPLVFTNYHLLSSDGAYVYRALSYLPVQPTRWDAYHKPLRTEATTPLRFVLSSPPLRFAYVLTIVAVLLFIASEGRRRQRAIPVVEPPRNDTLDFVETVGRLYYHHGDHAGLARKKIAHFKDYLRVHLRLTPRAYDDAFIRQVAERADVPEAEVRGVFEQMSCVGRQETLTEAELHTLNARIDTFYEASRR